VGDFQVAIRDIQMNFYRITRTIRLFYRKIHVIVAANTTTECPVFFSIQYTPSCDGSMVVTLPGSFG
jgi:hypothetical protein